MSSTLPRSRSLSSGAASVSSPSLVGTLRDRVRPVSLCESSWGRVQVPGGHARPLRRSPSQANNLSTTVPCSLVTKKLGGRHTPTRSSLRHSRMVVLHRTTNGKITTASLMHLSSQLYHIGVLNLGGLLDLAGLSFFESVPQ
ncbi:hypothetical protein FHG87_018084 [Trinorchestia longiramus]|nr:hypothetical protein FHG87_018084 [Trinorchestia longiramus]